MAQWNTANDMKKEYADVIAQQENSGLRGVMNATKRGLINAQNAYLNSGGLSGLYNTAINHVSNNVIPGLVNEENQARQQWGNALNHILYGNNANQSVYIPSPFEQQNNTGHGLNTVASYNPPVAKQAFQTQQAKPVLSVQTNPQTIAQSKTAQAAAVTNPATTHGLANTLLMQQLTALQQPPRLGLEQRPEDGLIMGANDPNSMNNQADNYKIARMASIANAGYDPNTEHAMLAALNNSWENRDSQKPKLMDLAGLAVKPQPTAPKYQTVENTDAEGNKTQVLVNPAAFNGAPVIDPTANQPNSREKINKVLTAMQNAKLAGDTDSYNTLYDHYLKLGGKLL